MPTPPEVEVKVAREPMFTTPQLAKYLQLSKRKVEHLVTSGEIPSYLIGTSRRIAVSDVDDWLRGVRSG